MFLACFLAPLRAGIACVYGKYLFVCNGYAGFGSMKAKQDDHHATDSERTTGETEAEQLLPCCFFFSRRVHAFKKRKLKLLHRREPHVLIISAHGQMSRHLGSLNHGLFRGGNFYLLLLFYSQSLLFSHRREGLLKQACPEGSSPTFDPIICRLVVFAFSTLSHEKKLHRRPSVSRRRHGDHDETSRFN